MNTRILPAAKKDLLNGHYFYEQQAPGLGAYFIDSLFSDIDSLMLYSGRHPVFFGTYHRMLSRRFPFAVYYIVERSAVVVCAILDCRKNPTWIKQRLGIRPLD